MKKGNRNITDFFKPRGSTSEPPRPAEPPPPGSNRPVWPSRHRVNNVSSKSSASTPSPRARQDAQTPGNSFTIATQSTHHSPAAVNNDSALNPSSGSPNPQVESPNESSLSASSPPRNMPPSSIETVPDEMDIALPPKPTSITPAESIPLQSSMAVNVSFASNASRRTVRDGVEAVLGSESDGSDSDSSLEEVGEILARHAPRPAAATLPPRASALRNSGSVSARTRSVASSSDRILPVARPRTEYKFSLQLLGDSVGETVAAEKRLAAKEETLRKLEAENKRAIEGHADSINENVIISALGESEDGSDVRRVLQAMKRTDVLHLDSVWHFFEDEHQQPLRRPFPTKCLPTYLRPIMRDPLSREQMFLSGIFRELLMQGSIPEELASWLIEEVCFQPSGDLQHAYLAICLRFAERISSAFNIELAQDLFRGVGAKPEALLTDAPLTTKRVPPKRELRALSPSLEQLLLLLQAAAPYLLPETRDYFIDVLLRLLCDDSVAAAISIQMRIQDTIGALIDSISSQAYNDTVSKTNISMLETVKEPILQIQLVCNLPSSSPSQQAFKRWLALSFFFCEPMTSFAELSTSTLPSRIIDHLSDYPLYHLSNDTNYPSFTASISLLDIAVDVGFFPVLEDGAVLPSKRDRKQFNNSIDDLCHKVRWLAGRIIDRGATNMARSEAKEVCSRLIHRLESAVRLGGKKRTNVFSANAEDDTEKSRNFLDKWRQKADEPDEDMAANAGIVDANG